MGTTVTVILCVVGIIYFISVKLNADKNKMLTTPYYKWDVIRKTAIRLQTFVGEYETLHDTPRTKQEWLDSFATTIFELGLVNLNNRKVAKTYLNRSQIQVMKQNKIAASISEKINNKYFKNFTSKDYENYIKMSAEEIAASLKQNN